MFGTLLESRLDEGIDHVIYVDVTATDCSTSPNFYRFPIYCTVCEVPFGGDVEGW